MLKKTVGLMGILAAAVGLATPAVAAEYRCAPVAAIRYQAPIRRIAVVRRVEHPLYRPVYRRVVAERGRDWR
jgi:hypothetical protein